MAEFTPGVATPETPVAATQATPETISTAEVVQTPAEAQPEPPVEKMLTQSEVNKLIAKEKARAEKQARREERAATERDIYKAQLERQQQQAQPNAELQEPKPDDYQGNYEGYLRALARYDRQVEKAQEQKQEQQRSQQENSQQASAQFARSFNDKVEAASEKYADLREKLVETSEHFTPPMIAALDQLDDGMDIAYHLATNNPKELARISRLPAVKQVIEFYEIGKKLAAPPKPTSTPPPIVPNGSKSTVEKDWSQMTDKEFAEKRRRQIAQRANR